MATALSGLNSVPALGSLNPSMLGAAGLSSLTTNLLQNGLAGASDLQTLMNQNTSNLLAQNQQLSALQNAGMYIYFQFWICLYQLICVVTDRTF